MGHRLPRLVPVGNDRVFSGNAEWKTLFPRRHEFGDWLPMARNYHRLTFFNQLEKAGKLRLGLMHVDLHVSMLVRILS